MKTLLTVLLILHVASGFTALITGGIASLTRKGGKGHRRSGKIYFRAMTGVFVTATSIGILKSLAFLFMVGFFSYYLVVRGYRVLYLKGLGRSQKAAALDWFISGTALLFGIGLVAWAVSQYTKGIGFWPVPLVFGSISAGFALADIKLYVKGPKTGQHWLAGHIASMGGGYIATWTAFVVTNVRFLPPVIVWLLPTAVGTFFIIRSIRRYAPKPKGAVKAAVAALLACFHLSSGAQAVYGTLNIAGLGQNLCVQLQAVKTDTVFPLRQRLLPGAGQPLFYTENVAVSKGRNKVGVAPSMETAPAQALEEVMKLMAGK